MKRITIFCYFFVVLTFCIHADTGISNISALIQGESVVITYTTNKTESRLFLYRSVSPFVNVSSLASAIIVDTFTSTTSTYIDYPIADIPYYYALLNEEEIISGRAVFIPGQNTTKEAVKISSIQEKAVETISSRMMPLPYLNLLPEAHQKSYDLSEKTRKQIADLLKDTDKSPKAFLSAYIFSVDTTVKPGGDDYALYQIIENYFKKGKWSDCTKELAKFLSVHRSDETTNRANFYLGQTLYFSGFYKEALFKFIEAEDTYPLQSGIWIEDILLRK